MKILAVSDEKSGFLYDYYEPGRLDGYDLIISCGDLSKNYLEFLVTMAHCPLFYVRGNHDVTFGSEPPEGCVCIDGKVVEYEGIRIAGLGGSIGYKSNAKGTYTEKEMTQRVRKLKYKLLLNKNIDILVTHSPARGVGDMETNAHRGFECLRDFLEVYTPKIHLHGHIHPGYHHNMAKELTFGTTRVINACGYTSVEL